MKCIIVAISQGELWRIKFRIVKIIFLSKILVQINLVGFILF